VQAAIELIRPGRSFAEFVALCPALPEAYQAQRYGVIVHGIGTDDEPPNIPFPGDPHTDMPEGEFVENMVLAVECYAGKRGAQDGVRLEDEVWVTGDGATVLSLYPYDAKLLG
jgi:Xaa-Pro aminopeptidase